MIVRKTIIIYYMNLQKSLYQKQRFSCFLNKNPYITRYKRGKADEHCQWLAQTPAPLVRVSD